MKEFYSSGLRFSCKRCSACCRYDAGFVYISQNDLDKLSAELKMEKNSFILTYCRWVANWQGKEVLSLREKSNKDCIFWDLGCKVYNARPLQCKTYPFWEYIVASEKTWKSASLNCPGIDSGEVHTGKIIGDYIKKKASEPIINRQGVS
jgi:Fe-S-cluster containining protein